MLFCITHFLMRKNKVNKKKKEKDLLTILKRLFSNSIIMILNLIKAGQIDKKEDFNIGMNITLRHKMDPKIFLLNN